MDRVVLRFKMVPFIACHLQNFTRHLSFSTRSRSYYSNSSGAFRTISKYFIFPTLSVVKMLPLHDDESNHKNRKMSECEKNIAHKLAMANILMELGNYETTKRILLKVAERAEENHVYNGLCNAYISLSCIAYFQKDTIEGINILENVINKLITLGVSEDDNRVLFIRVCISNSYALHNHNELAEENYKLCLKVQEAKLASSDPNEESYMILVIILNAYAGFLYNKGRFKEAKKKYEEVCKISQKIRSIHPEWLIYCLYSLGITEFRLNAYDNALEHFIDAAKLGMGTNDINLPNCYLMAAITYFEKGFYYQAKQWSHKAMISSENFDDCVNCKAKELLKKIEEKYQNKI